MALADPPTHVPIAVTAERSEGDKLPALIASKRWLDWFGSLILTIGDAPMRRARLSYADQQDEIALTPFPLGNLVAGLWRVSYYMRVTTPATDSSSLTVTTTWTDGGVAQTSTAAAETGNLTTSHQFGTLFVRTDANTPVSLSVAYASVGAQVMIYDFEAVLESLVSV